MNNITKEQVLNLIEETIVISLKVLPINLRDDREVVLLYVKNNALFYMHASERLRDDKEIALEAISKDSKMLYKASARLQEDKDIVLAAMKTDKFILSKCSKMIQNNREILEELEKTNVDTWFGNFLFWYQERMDFLNNLRNQEEKELMENSIIISKKITKKNKF